MIVKPPPLPAPATLGTLTEAAPGVVNRCTFLELEA